ncbi:MAG: hypothetical protein ACXVA9_01405, partial [Bdellovibrionales bacterium]
AIVALRENMVRDLGGVLNPIVDKLVAADEDSKNWFTGELGDLHRKQLIEDLFTTCSLHVDYDFGDALRSILVDLGNKFETMKAQK